MIPRAAVLLPLLWLAAPVWADTENVRKSQSQLQFRPAGSAASGSTAAPSRAAYSEKHGMFRHLDIDGDGFVSKAEAAGFAGVTLGFDRADRNRDGKLSFAEYDSIGASKPAAKRMAKGKSSASAGATKKPN
jgi:prophage tail gpP-like protein